MVASPEVVNAIGENEAQIIRYADLASAYDKTGEIAGAIDALELRADGSIRWLAQKPECAGQ